MLSAQTTQAALASAHPTSMQRNDTAVAATVAFYFHSFSCSESWHAKVCVATSHGEIPQ